ncbi:hypothetical protein [Paraburkholderia bannensis]|nr:hypothetical protein [Paraburkholderia bannensis]
MVSDAHQLWQTVEDAHRKASLLGKLYLPMESFVRAVDFILKESE